MYNAKMAADDVSRFMTINHFKRKPIFKNYIQNNTSILRREVQLSKM